MKRYTLDLVAGAIKDADIGGEYFLVDVAPSPYKVEFFGGNSVKREESLDAAQPADWATPEKGFARMKFLSAVTQTIFFYVSNGRTGNNRFSGSITSSVEPIGIAYTQTKVTVTGASAQALAANANRRKLAIQNPPINADAVFIRAEGGVAVADPTSFRLDPGQTWEPEAPPLGQVNVIRGGAANFDIHVIEG